MKSLMPWFCVAALAGNNLLYADDGLDAFRQGDYLVAANQLGSKANKVSLQNYYMGYMCLYGYGCLKDNLKALEYFNQSASQGYLPAQIFLGRYYLSQGKDPQKAFFWFKKAADKGDLAAEMYVAGAYLFGYGVQKNADQARRYYIAAAKDGNPIAQYTLGMNFLSSRDNRNRALGLIWLKKAAIQGNLKAQAALTAEDQKQGMQAKIEKKSAKMVSKIEPINEIKPIEASVLLAKWLSDDASDNLTAGSYGLKGIFADWKNSNALGANHYNQAPQLNSLDPKRIYTPEFLILKPEEIAINDYLDAIVPKIHGEGKNVLAFPRYPINSQMQAAFSGDSNSLVGSGSGLLINSDDAVLISKDESLSKETPPADKARMQAVLDGLYNQAILGQAEAQFELGQLYQYGIAVKQNFNQAILYFELAAIQQDIQAEYNLGLLYLEGKTTPLNYAKGLEWMHDAAFKGNAYAQYVLGLIYEKGLKDAEGTSIVEADYAQALSMYYLASANHLGQAEYRLAYHLAENKNADLGVVAQEKRMELIKSLYQSAFDQGVTEAALPLAYYDAASSEPNKQAKAFELAKAQADRDNPEAALLLGLMYARGIAVPEDKKAAMTWFEKVGSLSPVSAFILGTDYAEGLGVEQDLEKGQSLLQAAADADFAPANFNLAILKQRNHEDFIPDLAKAKSLGNSKAGLLLADYYLSSASESENLQEARDIYQSFADKGDKDAEMKLGFIYDQGLGVEENPELAKNWYTKAAVQDQKLAQYLLGRWYQLRQGEAAVMQARHWYQKAEKAYPQAAVALGFLYDTLDADYAKAANYYQMAADAGDTAGLFDLGLIYEYGKGQAVNYQKAADLYTRAANLGNSKAMIELAGLYTQGLIDGRKNEKVAMEWYEKAANLNDPGAFYPLGALVESTPGKMTQALTYYEKAASLGDERAKEALQRLQAHTASVKGPTDS